MLDELSVSQRGTALAARLAERRAMKKYNARVDADLRELIPGFMAHKRADAHEILAGISSGHVDFESVSRIGHKIKGEGGSYGLHPVSIYGAEIEQAARSHDVEAIRRCANELAAYLDAVQIEYVDDADPFLSDPGTSQ